MKNFVAEIKWRGMLHDIMPGTEEKLNAGMVSGYIGFDPTAESLHVGSLAQIMTLIHFQRSGHKPYVLVGGATGMVGDPSGKSTERNLLSEEILLKNVNGIKNQLSKFLDFENGSNAAVMVNNFDWFKNISFLDFIRDVGKHITVNYMMAKDSVKNRLEAETGMSFTEFSYQLVQGYDFFHLWKEHNCLLQMGGSDQWGNIVTGTELIRRKSAGEAYALTTQLIKKSDGNKFGKSESGNIWLDKNLTSPYHFYQFWLNASDADAESWIKIFTLLEKNEIENLIAEHKLSPEKRILQKKLAEDITVRVHSEKDLELVLKANEFFFGKGDMESISNLSEPDLLNLLIGADKFFIDSFFSSNNIVEFLAELKCHSEKEDKWINFFDSKSEIKKLIQQGAIYINKQKIMDLDFEIGSDLYFLNKILFVQKGKKNFIMVIKEDRNNWENYNKSYFE